MKRLLVLSFLLLACQKTETTAPEPEPPPSMTGAWFIKAQSGSTLANFAASESENKSFTGTGTFGREALTVTGFNQYPKLYFTTQTSLVTYQWEGTFSNMDTVRVFMVLSPTLFHHLIRR